MRSEMKKNIVICLIIFLLIYFYNSVGYITGHDFHYTYRFKDLEIASTRIPAAFLTAMLYKILPCLFHAHPIDFKTGIIGCSLISIYFFGIVLLLSRGFFFFSDKKKYLQNPEVLFILPLCFIALTIPACMPGYDIDRVYNDFADMQVYLDHSGGLLLYFAFFVLLINAVLGKIKCRWVNYILCSLVGLILGSWTELLNISVFFSSLLMISFLFFLKKELLKNKLLICLFTGFFVGLFLYYRVLNDFSLSSVGTIGEYDIIGRFSENMKSINEFFRTFISLYITQKILLFICIFALLCFIYIKDILTKFKLFTFPPTTTSILGNNIEKDYKQNVNILVIALFSMVSGFFLCLFCSLFLTNYRVGCETWILERATFQFIFVNILEFVILSLAGIFYFSLQLTQKKIFCIVAGIMTCLLFVFKFVPQYQDNMDIKIENRKINYDIENTVAVYSALGEAAVMPKDKFFEQLQYNIAFFFVPSAPTNSPDDSYRILTNGYWLHKYVRYHYYYDFVYKNKLIGIRFEDDETAIKKLKERIKFLGIENEEKRGLRFSDIMKYGNYDLSTESIEEREKLTGNSNLALKVKAYVYFKERNYKKALELYNKYLENNEDDVDALVNIALIYESYNNLEAARKIYIKLLNTYKKNFTFNFRLMNIYFEEQDYANALKINSEFIRCLNSEYTRHNLQGREDILPMLYINQAVIYIKMNDKKKAEEYLNLAKNINCEKVQEFMNSYEAKTFEDLFKLDNISILDESQFETDPLENLAVYLEI